MSKLTVKLAQERMEQAREDVAGQLLDWEKVTAAIGGAAGKGLELVVFAPPAGVGIKATEKAAEVVQRLTQAGFRVGWRERRDPGDVIAHDLVIGWAAATLGP